MSRTVLISRIRRWLAPSVSRRAFLRTAVASLPAALPLLKGAGAPRVAIIGAGIAGLYAATLLKRSGVSATIYESSQRAGGRMFSATGLLGDGLTTELGGEFIDSVHTEILGLAKQFSLPLIDTQSDEEKKLVREAYLFGGQLRSEETIAADFRALAPRITRDARWPVRFDRMSIAEYLDNLGARGWFRSLLEVAFLTEYGLEVDRQSAANLLSLISPQQLRLFGDSDERYKILGGNQRVTDELQKEVAAQIQYGNWLEAISRRGEAYVLDFGGKEEVADIVLLAIPFSILRRIALRVSVPALKRTAIYELAYGTGSKLMFGVQRRLWRTAGYGGNLFSDEPFQLAWDSSRGQRGDAGSVTLLCGGNRGLELARGGTEHEIQKVLPGLELAWKGIESQRNGKSARFLWPSHPHTLGCYSCYAPGQWSTIRGNEFSPVDRLHFAGEHTSRDFQGFMEGGAETGKRAARAILRQCGVKPSF